MPLGRRTGTRLTHRKVVRKQKEMQRGVHRREEKKKKRDFWLENRSEQIPRLREEQRKRKNYRADGKCVYWMIVQVNV